MQAFHKKIPYWQEGSRLSLSRAVTIGRPSSTVHTGLRKLDAKPGVPKVLASCLIIVQAAMVTSPTMWGARDFCRAFGGLLPGFLLGYGCTTVYKILQDIQMCSEQAVFIR